MTTIYVDLNSFNHQENIAIFRTLVRESGAVMMCAVMVCAVKIFAVVSGSRFFVSER